MASPDTLVIRQSTAVLSVTVARLTQELEHVTDQALIALARLGLRNTWRK